MSDTEYLTRAEAVLAAVERTVDDANDGDHDIDLERNGSVLTLSFENGSKIIVNLQPPMKEVWIAAKAGGFHYRFIDGEWRDTRTGTEFFSALTEYATQQAGLPITFSAP
ncbi:protein CyaY [Burkholderia lata]|uniref:Iron-sulfur cluster assembly protein CyaY n=1 Tax=Burkholderia lata (strain ATCC 17760 / DSM 23089 / LMG 22485 / NCIMB 9086 / R18194 / 383) TaxID=482957 RepID=A0A6P3B1J8_BURL3|nr:iron donor protein CyaY [Burkholderia lata]VWD53020.1 protein CyaY [Burkholderia lata]